jgi:hypothetical protein
MNLIFAIIDPKKSMMFFWPKNLTAILIILARKRALKSVRECARV